jgi:hypothetical protein
MTLIVRNCSPSTLRVRFDVMLVLLVSRTYPVVSGAVDNLPAVRIDLDASRFSSVAQMASWPGITTRRVCIAIAVVSLDYWAFLVAV